MFLLRLATEVDYDGSDEASMIHQVTEELSFYYARFIDFLTLQAQAVGYGNSTSTMSHNTN